MVGTFICFNILSTFVGLPPPKRIEDDRMMFPTGMSPTEGWESQLVENVQERHFCVTVIFVPSLESTFLSHSDWQTGQNRKSPRSDDSATRNRFCWWGGAFLGDSLWIIQWIFSGLFLLKHLNFLLQCIDFIMFRTLPPPFPPPLEVVTDGSHDLLV